MKFYREIERRLQSLHDSTDLRIETEEITAEFTRRCSPFTSHQGCVVSQGHGFPWLVVLSNTRVWLALCPVGREDGFKGDHAHRKIHSSVVEKGLFTFPVTRPSWLNNSLVTAVIEDRFSGYGDDGRPLFEKKISLSYEGKVIFEPSREKEDENKTNEEGAASNSS
jgi:hypothetical protein